MSELADRVRAAQPFLETAIQEIITIAEIVDSCDVKLMKENLNQLRTALSKALQERDEARTQIKNFQEFNDKQRKQLELLQEEMGTIHMFINATSRDDLANTLLKTGRDLPFLLEAVYTVMSRYFDAKQTAEKRGSMIRAARQELES